MGSELKHLGRGFDLREYEMGKHGTKCGAGECMSVIQT